MMTFNLHPANRAAKIIDAPASRHYTCLSLFNGAPEISYKRGELIFDARHQGQYIFLVTAGIVKISSFYQNHEMLHDYLMPDEIMNGEAVFSTQSQELMATAATNLTRVKKIPISSFREALEAKPELHQEFISHLLRSMNRTRERLLRLALLPAEQRVIHFLITHTEKAGRRVGFEYVIKPLPTHQEIGYIAGTGRQTVTTVLNELRRQGIVHFNRQYLLVRNLDALKAKAAL